MAKVQDKNRLYAFLRPFVDFRFRCSYRRIQYVGVEKIPTDGAVILAPNHTNALQDALAVLSINRDPKVFVARADIFQKPRLAKILHFLKIMPILRIRDGISNLTKNDEIMERAVDVLIDGVPFCILPEGKHRAKHSLLPLGKGVFRIAVRANERLSGEKPVYIVPIGVEYGSFFRFRSSVLINVGDAINVTDFIAKNCDLELPELYNGLRDMLTEAMQKQILWIPDDEQYDATLEMCYLFANQNDKTLLSRLCANQKVVEKVQNMREQGNVKLLEQAADVAQKRRAAHVGVDSIQAKHLFADWLWRSLLILLFAPYFAVCAVATLPVWAVAQIVLKRIKDEAFHNSFRCVLTLILLPLSLLICFVLLFVFLPWKWTILAILLLLPANAVFHEYLRWCRLWLSHLRLLTNKDLRQRLRIIISTKF